ncbi:MAG: hypothetical protein JOZ77_04285 [Candidatus Eremiobacteraeota bacterium]|nr:hypothetical protein [Candidatus Eremiobacteraeota bacterium]
MSLAVGVTGRPASAALDFFIGARTVVKDAPLSACNGKARDALISVLGKAAEYGDTGNWEGLGATDASGNSFAAAAVHCYPLDAVHGYLVTLTCAAQTPPATESASVICGKLATAFGGQQ